jgi:hypothetical protein
MEKVNAMDMYKYVIINRFLLDMGYKKLRHSHPVDEDGMAFNEFCLISSQAK